MLSALSISFRKDYMSHWISPCSLAKAALKATPMKKELVWAVEYNYIGPRRLSRSFFMRAYLDRYFYCDKWYGNSTLRRRKEEKRDSEWKLFGLHEKS